MALADEASTTGHIAVAVLPEPGSRPRIRAALMDYRIQSSFHYPPIHAMTAYRDLPSRPLPHTKEAADRFVTLPLHPYLTDSEVHEVVSVVTAAL